MARSSVSNPDFIVELISINSFFFFSAGPIPLRVREAELPIVSDAECIRKINAVTEKIFILPASSFCAGGEAGNDACQVNEKNHIYYLSRSHRGFFVTLFV